MAETSVPTTAEDLDLGAVRSRIDAVLDDFLADRVDAAGRPEPGMRELAEAVRDLVASGGKRLRPLLCVLGWRAAGAGPEPSDAVLRAAASLELFHACALIHDDVMDGSDRRRGRPTVHRALAARHAGPLHPAADRTGTAAAILAGDLALTWSDELLHTAGLTNGQLADVLPLVDTMRAEAVHGQYLDLTATARSPTAVEDALQVARYKTAKYTFERPLHLGAALAGASRQLHEALSAYALPAGGAFQLRDDLLGVFGDPRLTGKPVLDDLRNGRPTVLLSLAFERATKQQEELLDEFVGRPDIDEDGAALVRDVVRTTGAVGAVESMIGELRRQALAALESARFASPVRAALRRVAGEP